MPQTPLNDLRLLVELKFGLEKSRKGQGISCCLKSGNPVNETNIIWATKDQEKNCKSVNFLLKGIFSKQICHMLSYLVNILEEMQKMRKTD